MAEVIRTREISILEFDRIRQDLAALTVSPMGLSKASELEPLSDLIQVKKRQAETGEAKLISARSAFAPAAVEDISPLISRAAKGALLYGTDLARVKVFIRAARRWPLFFRESEQLELYPLLAEQATLIKPAVELGSQLEKAVDEDGNILDSASPELSSIRTKKQNLQNKIRDKLDDYIRSSNHRRYLQEALVTIRSGRFVLPVKQEYRQQLDGVVHDQSASGATLFIEPLPVVRMQNDLVSLQRQEEQEIEKILYRLSSLVATAEDDLIQNSVLYGELDFIIARGRLSLNINGVEPLLLDADESPEIYLVNARHPLLPGERIPLTVRIDDQVSTLVITGPNTGGKTVALKTIGLLSVMVQSGLHIPAEQGTRLTVFNRIRADIGDEQSIAQSLSTFSGHLNNIIAIIEAAGPRSLVLFDELGAGTDPSEGAALAMAVLSELTARGVLTVATTHINELKLFAQVRDRMQNASMEFDPDTLSPTYRLLQGVPGQSNALHIAEKLGLDKALLDQARSYLHRSHDQVESVIASLFEDQQRYQRDSRQAEIDRSRAEVILAELEKDRELLKARREDILQQAREEARLLLRKTKSTAEKLITELKDIRTDQPVGSDPRIERIRHDLSQLRRDVEDSEESDYEETGLTAEEVVPGDLVFIPSIKQKGEVLSLSGNEVVVQIGSIRINLAPRDLQWQKSGGQRTKKKQPNAGGGYSVDKDLAINSSVDLRGLSFDEARPLVDKLLDNALWAGLNRVDLIHGKGTGKLKEALRSYLQTHPLVGKMRSGNPAEGGEGVTVIDLKV
ncbi:MAG: endonuclease MutS2 [Firmicutes bacterium]|nr:endonuclease MutS2 [Bacillota bacterium]